MYIGGFLGGMLYSKVTDILGRKPSLFLSYAITAIAAVIQGAAQNIAMFVVGRILVGFGNGCSTVAAPTYIAETLPHNWRAWGLGIMNDFYYVGESRTGREAWTLELFLPSEPSGSFITSPSFR